MKDKDGNVRIWLAGQEIKLPPEGTFVVYDPQITYKSHSERVDENEWDRT